MSPLPEEFEEGFASIRPVPGGEPGDVMVTEASAAVVAGGMAWLIRALIVSIARSGGTITFTRDEYQAAAAQLELDEAAGVGLRAWVRGEVCVVGNNDLDDPFGHQEAAP